MPIFFLDTVSTSLLRYLLPSLSHPLSRSIHQRGDNSIGPWREIAQQAGYGHLPLLFAPLRKALFAAQVTLIFQE